MSEIIPLRTYKTIGKRQANQMIEKIETQAYPTDCLSCGSCEAHCPQNIEIPKIMDELKILF